MSISTDLTPTRTEIISGMLREYEAFAALVAPLTADEWAAPSRCEGFAVRDVAGHVIGLAEDVAAGKPGSRTAEEEAASLRHLPPAEAAGRLTAALVSISGLAAAVDDDAVWAGPSGVADLTMGDGILTLWYDTWVHADDIRVALGRATEAGAGERAALAYLGGQLTARGFGPVRIEPTTGGYPAVEIGATDPSTPTLRMTAHELILAATGRLDAQAVGLDPSVNIYAA